MICLITARAIQCMCSIGLVCDITGTQILVDFNLIKIVLAQRVRISLRLRLEIHTHSKSCHLNFFFFHVGRGDGLLARD